MTRPSSDELHRLFKIDIANGWLFWRQPPKNHSRLLGKEAGSRRKSHSGKAYWHIKINGVAYKRSHLIFFLVHGYWPWPNADHKDGDSLNDSIDNLRQATVTENAWNHKRRKRRIRLPMGVRSLPSGRYQARIGFHGKQLHLGAFDTPEEARAVHLAKRKELYGQFA